MRPRACACAWANAHARSSTRTLALNSCELRCALPLSTGIHSCSQLFSLSQSPSRAHACSLDLIRATVIPSPEA
eukprot:2789096-Pleurochrysis_carterae.AAC.1